MSATAKKTWKPSYTTPSRKRLNTIVRATIATSAMGGMMVMAAPAMAVPGGGANTECGDGFTFVSKDDGLSGFTHSWSSSTPIDKVIVKAGTDSKSVAAGGATSGTVDSTGMVNGGGQQPEISHVTLCAAEDLDEDTDEDLDDDTDEDLDDDDTDEDDDDTDEDDDDTDEEVEDDTTPTTPTTPVTPSTPAAPVVEAAVVEAPAVVAVPAAATAQAPAAVNAAAPATVAVPGKATIPAAVPAGGGSTQTDFPVWGVAMIAAAALAAAGSGIRLAKKN